MCRLSIIATAALLPGLASSVEEVPVEVHGFTSLGYLVTTDNEYLADDSTDGTTELWEFGLNASYKPADSWRLGAQVFARDMGETDNGRIQLDWAFLEYRDRDAVWGQAGRVKVPIGLYNEELDVDAARVPVFLPQSVYPRQLRDLYIAVDGAKVAGFLPAGAAGSFEYAAYGGWKQIDEDSGTADALRGIGSADSSSGLGQDLEIEPSLAYGAMLHWHTPLEGLGLRVTGVTLRDLEATGRQPGPIPGSTVTSVLEVDDYPLLVLSAAYEVGDWLLAAEYARFFADGIVTSTIDLPFPAEERDFSDDTEGWYLSATWHARPRLDLYAAIDFMTDDPGDYSTITSIHNALVVAARYNLRDDWLIKAEVNRVEGTSRVLAGEDGGDPQDDWWMVAFKTTVDF